MWNSTDDDFLGFVNPSLDRLLQTSGLGTVIELSTIFSVDEIDEYFYDSMTRMERDRKMKRDRDSRRFSHDKSLFSGEGKERDMDYYHQRVSLIAVNPHCALVIHPLMSQNRLPTTLHESMNLGETISRCMEKAIHELGSLSGILETCAHLTIAALVRINLFLPILLFFSIFVIFCHLLGTILRQSIPSDRIYMWESSAVNAISR